MKALTDKQKKKYAKYLASGEELVAVFGISDRFFWTSLVTYLPLSLVLVGLPFLYRLMHLRHGRRYLLTSRRLLVRRGILSTEITSAPYTHIARITVKENFWHKLGYRMGDVIIQTTGPTPVELHLVYVSDPIRVKNLIEELVVSEKALPQGKEANFPLVKPL